MPVSLAKLPVVVAELSVCIDCHTAHHHAETPAGADREPWALWPGADVADASSGEDGQEFSWRACDGCGTTLGGDRFPYVVFG